MLFQWAKIIGYINLGMIGLLVLFFLPRVVLIFCSLFYKRRAYPQAKMIHRFAALICARNEEKVIANLIKSIKENDYPLQIDVFVAADNCTDRTAELAREAGAIVYERFDTSKKGKAFALDFLIKNIFEHHNDMHYEAFVFFDADNLIGKNYFTEINKVYDSGFEIFTSYRSTKNFSSNWLTAGCGLMMQYDTAMAQRAKVRLGMGALVAGTGFVAASEIFRQKGGWNNSDTMTEDLEFSIEQSLKGRTIGYCDENFYDEYPEKLKDSINQRARWIRGAYQNYAKSKKKMWRAVLTGRGEDNIKLNIRQRLTIYDIIIFIAPTPLLCTIWFTVYFGAMIALSAISLPDTRIAFLTLLSAALFVGVVMVGAFMFGIIIALSQRKRIKAKKRDKFRAIFAFPIFLTTWIPIAFLGKNKKLKWQPIPHDDAIDVDQMQKRDEE